MLKGSTLARSWRGGRTRWLALIFITGVLMLSIPSGKRDLYLLPLMPAMAVPVGVWLSRVGSRRGGAWDRSAAWTLATLFVFVAVVVVVATTWIRSGATLPFDVDADTRRRLESQAGVAASGFRLVVLALFAAWTVRELRRPRLGPSVALLAVVTFFVLHFSARELLDPFRDMSDGARRIEALSADRPLLAFSADETTLAVIPFYSSTHVLVLNSENPAFLLERLRSGRSKHLLVMDKDVRKLSKELRKGLVLRETVRLSATREVAVYGWGD